jgi:hypothetical protein
MPFVSDTLIPPWIPLVLAGFLFFMGFRAQKGMRTLVQKKFERTTREFLAVMRPYRSPAGSEEPNPREVLRKGRAALVRIFEGELFWEIPGVNVG